MIVNKNGGKISESRVYLEMQTQRKQPEKFLNQSPALSDKLLDHRAETFNVIIRPRLDAARQTQILSNQDLMPEK